METVKTATYSILINREPKGFITPTRGIRQGDPLSPYLFLLYAEGLSPLIQKAADTNRLKGIYSCRGGVCISHLLFADDSLLFVKQRLENAANCLISLHNMRRPRGRLLIGQRPYSFLAKIQRIWKLFIN